MARPTTKVKNKCIRCGNEFLFKPTQVKYYKNAGQFCSVKCSHSFTYTCGGCGKKRNDGYVEHQAYCNKKCQYAARAKDPIRKKAFTMSSFITFGGKGKLEYFDNLLRSKLNTPCRYCTTLLTLENVSLDHIEPFVTTEARKNLAIKRQMDRASNLQIICRGCNQMKGNLSHENFVKLMDFLDKNPSISAYVRKKLSQSNIMWSHKRAAKAR